MLPFSEACERNKGPILEVLRIAFADRAQVLEIGSGTGQHAVHFAAHLAHLAWQPTEQLAYLSDLASRVKLEGTRNLRQPTVLDVKQTVWPLRSVDAIFSANTLHIMGWSAVCEFFRGAAAVLVRPGVLCVYGPFRFEGRHTSESNAAFDHYLRQRDPESGVRDFEALDRLAGLRGLKFTADHAMPANNRTLVWRMA
jgi:cyclopropane fatty-acyl-phospholipid synthase-like methyltransferase